MTLKCSRDLNFPAILFLGTAFFKGVYLSREASTSANYALPHPVTGKRYMYYARAVEKYANSTINNEIDPVLVFYYDNESYPEYLITFQNIMV